MKIYDYFKLAGKTAIQKIDTPGPRRHYMIGAVGVRSDGAIVKSPNSPTPYKDRLVHAENKVAKKLDYGATVYVARVKYMDGSFGISRPCFDCYNTMISRRVRKVFYTIDSEFFGMIDLKTNIEKTYRF